MLLMLALEARLITQHHDLAANEQRISPPSLAPSLAFGFHLHLSHRRKPKGLCGSTMSLFLHLTLHSSSYHHALTLIWHSTPPDMLALHSVFDAALCKLLTINCHWTD